MIRLWTAGLALLVALVAAIPSRVDARSRHDGGLWVVNEIQVPLTEQFSFHLMAQSRLTRDLDRYERTVVRPWLRTTLPHGFALSLGYDAHIFENPRATEEHRAWQRIEYERPFGEFTGFGHFWLEERFFGGEQVAWRGRVAIGGAYDWSEKLRIFARQEFLIDLNRTPTIEQRGLGENQLLVGVSRQIMPGLTLNVGYLMVYLDESPDLFNHNLAIGFAVRTPRLSDLFSRTR